MRYRDAGGYPFGVVSSQREDGSRRIGFVAPAKGTFSLDVKSATWVRNELDAFIRSASPAIESETT